MNVLLQRHCAKYIYVVPEGLRELMSDISREVLRSQPEEIYAFIADYLDALMITRENARVAARFVQSISDIGVTIVELLIRTGMSREDADRVTTIIQRAFRKHLAEKIAAQRQERDVVREANIITEILDEAGITPEQAEQTVIIIQRAYRLFKHRQEQEKDLLKGMVDWRVAARSTMRLYRKTGVTYEEANRAATLIKAAYKGYYSRRIMKRLVEKSEELSLSEATLLEEEPTQYLPYWEELGEASFYDQFEDLDEETLKDIAKEIPDDVQTIALNIVDSILQHALPDSSSTGSKTDTTDKAEAEVEAKFDLISPPTLPKEVSDSPPPTSESAPDAADSETDTTTADTSDVAPAVEDE